MNAEGAAYIVGLLESRLRGQVDLDFQHSKLFSEEIELPESIGNELNYYFISGDLDVLIDSVTSLVRSFSLASIRPEDHLAIVAFLRRNERISKEEACDLAKLDPSNFPLMREASRNVVRMAEIASEEQRMGVRDVGSDNFFDSILFGFAAEHGSGWGAEILDSRS